MGDLDVARRGTRRVRLDHDRERDRHHMVEMPISGMSMHSRLLVSSIELSPEIQLSSRRPESR
jgi:hypothetical protein